MLIILWVKTVSTRVENVSGLCLTGYQHVSAVAFSVQIFIFENNIYYRATMESRVIRLVSTGKEGVVFNGLADWLYEGKTTESSHHQVLMYKYICCICMEPVLDPPPGLPVFCLTVELKLVLTLFFVNPSSDVIFDGNFVSL